MHFLYNFAIKIYEISIHLAGFFNPKAKSWVEGRKNYFDKLPEINASKVFWFHCASLGEFDMALPVINALKSQHPDIFVLVSFFSPSGMEHYHKRKHKVDLAVYLPSDTPKNARKFIAHFHPKKAFFVKYEFWSNYIFEAKKQHVQLFSICTLFRDDHRFFKWYGGFFRKTLRQIDFFYTQNESSSLLLADIDLNNYLTIGDTRFDRVIEAKSQLESNVRIEEFLAGEKAFIIGSSWPVDEKFLAEYILQHPNKKIIIAPHNVDENHILSIEQLFEQRTQRYTDSNTTDKNILILNTIGNLASAYSYGDVAYIGGGFTGQLHNILEPAVYGLPVVFGPKFKRFPEANHFLHLGIGFSVSSHSELQQTLSEIYENLDVLSTLTSATVLDSTGASNKMIAHLEGNYEL